MRERLLHSSGRGAPPVCQPGENPWLNELLGSRRAQAQGLRVGLVVVDWFVAASSSGALNAAGRALLERVADGRLDSTRRARGNHGRGAAAYPAA